MEETKSNRIHIRFTADDDDVLRETQKSEGLEQSWFLLKSESLDSKLFNSATPAPIAAFSPVTKRRLTIEGNNIAYNEAKKLKALEKEPVASGLLQLTNEEFVKGKGGYESDNDEELLTHLTDIAGPSSVKEEQNHRKRKVPEKFQCSRDHIENGKEIVDSKTTPEEKRPSKSARRKYAKRRWLKEMKKIQMQNLNCESEGPASHLKLALYTPLATRHRKEDQAKKNKVEKRMQKGKKQEPLAEINDDGQRKELLHRMQAPQDNSFVMEKKRRRLSRIVELHRIQAPRDNSFVKEKKCRRQNPKAPSRSAMRKYAKRRRLKEMKKNQMQTLNCDSERNWKEDQARKSMEKGKQKWEKQQHHAEINDGQPKGSQVRYIGDAMERALFPRGRTLVPRLVGWNLMGSGRVVLHVDGSLLGNPGRAAFGGVISDGNGQWADGFMGFTGIAGNLEAVFHGLWNGVRRLQELIYVMAWGYPDSKDPIRLVRGNNEEKLLADIAGPSGVKEDRNHRKRKAPEKLQGSRKKHCSEANKVQTAKNDKNDLNDKENEQENGDSKTAPGEKGPSRCTRRKFTRRQRLKEMKTVQMRNWNCGSEGLGPSRCTRRKFARRQQLKEMKTVQMRNRNCGSEGLWNRKDDQAQENKVEKGKQKWKKQQPHDEINDDGQPRKLVPYTGDAVERASAPRFRALVPRLVGWNPMGGGRVVLHVDGSSFGNPGRAGFGGVIRCGNGEWVEGFMGFIGIAGNCEAELHGLWNGVRRLHELNYVEAWCYTDSKEVIRLVRDGVDDGHELCSLVRRIRQVLVFRPRFELLHIFREGNSVADSLAKRGANSEEFYTTWSFPPNDVSNKLFADMSGVMYPRY